MYMIVPISPIKYITYLIGISFIFIVAITNGTPVAYAAYSSNESVILKHIESFDSLSKRAVFTYDRGYYQQGACYNTKNNRILLGIVKNGYIKQKILVVNPDNMQIEKIMDYSTLGHMNTITYRPDKNEVYVFTQLDDTGKHVAEAPNVIILDGDTLEEIRNIHLQQSIDALDYDTKRKEFFAVRCNVENEPYTLYRYDNNFNLLEKRTYLRPFKTVGNGFAIHDGRFLHLSWNGIIEGSFFGGFIKFVLCDFSKVELEDAFYMNGHWWLARPVGYGITELYHVK